MGQSLSERYRLFSVEEARGKSALYEELSQGIADDPAILSELGELPSGKQQPNLLLAACRHVFGTARNYIDFREKLSDKFDQVRDVVLSRSTQTNEPADVLHSYRP